MTTYVQTTIHSKIAKQEKTSAEGLGSLYKGRIAQLKSFHSVREKELEIQISKEIQILPKSKVNINRKMRNKVIPSLNKGQEIILMESGVFPAIYFKKTTMRNVLKQFIFPQNVKALPPSDDRTPLIFQIISNLFSEITFFIFNILIGENSLTNSYYIFFSDSETIPFTKCCNAPVYIQLMQNGSGKILCNALKCPHSNIAQFLINFEDGKKLWKNITYFADASEKDKELRNRICKLILNGKYKKKNLVNIVQDTSKQIVDLFYSMKQKDKQQYAQQHIDHESQSPFLTGALIDQKEEDQINTHQPITEEEILSPEDNNIDILKMKIHYMAKNSKDLQKNISKSIVNEGKVFHKNFEMIKKIDQFMLTQKSSKNNTRINFPRLMDQLRKTKRKNQSAQKQASLSGHQSFV